METILHELAGTKYFTKIDLKWAYNQIIIHEKFKEVTITNTPICLLLWTCLSYGIKTTSAIFQKAFENISLEKIENMIIYQGDICVGASSKELLKQKPKKKKKKTQKTKNRKTFERI